MNKKKIYLNVILIAFVIVNSFSQSISVGMGLSAYGNPGDGLSLSTEFQIPVFTSITVAPIYTYSKTLKNSEIDHAWNEIQGTEIALFNKDNLYSTSSSFRLFIYFKPTDLLENNEKLKKIDFKLGVGYGVYFSNSVSYEMEDNLLKYYHYKYKNGYNWAPRVSYTYHLKKYFIGCDIGYDYTTIDEYAFFIFKFGLSL